MKTKLRATTWRVFVQSLLIASFLCCTPSTFAQQSEYKVKAEFIERFTRFIEWPFDSQILDASRPFIIGVIGENPFGNFLQELAINRKIKEKTTEVWIVTDFSRLNNCDLLFISKSEKYRLSEILAEIEGKPILTIGDTVGYSENGVLINFYHEQSSIRFEINASAIQKSKLKFNARLLKLARIVESSKHGSF